ncbi:MAG: XRE family transcriptional regulator [Chitinophagaceae bacterium]|nr:helix-turn-helix transcriptional regulator [Sphingobacteriales bacterium]TXJ23121.1 MAG: XRE family transcriptional regulator [Chitinophagaceae bacterium]HEX2846671.1 helix-turn-helix transcriptional regulator [Chitinophagaceae bacterium]
MAEKQRIKYNSIKAALANARVKNKDLAAYLNVTAQLVSKWVTNTNQPSIQMFYKIAGSLNVDVRTLLEPNDLKGDRPDLPIEHPAPRKKTD